MSFKGHHIQGTLHPRTFEASLFSRVVKESPHPRATNGLLGYVPLKNRYILVPLEDHRTAAFLKDRCTVFKRH
jgi:hypothetical protein